MLQIFIQILLICVLILQLILSISMLIRSRKEYKNSEKFYNELCESLKNQPAVFLDEGVQCEQPKENASEK